MKRALDEFVVEGVKTTIPFHRQLMDHPDYVSGNYTTKFMEDFEMESENSSTLLEIKKENPFCRFVFCRFLKMVFKKTMSLYVRTDASFLVIWVSFKKTLYLGK